MTICTHERRHLFGMITEAEMHISPIGVIAEKCLQNISKHFPSVFLDSSVVMPNHIHLLLALSNCGDVQQENHISKVTLGNAINVYKGSVTRIVHTSFQKSKATIWQSRYHDHIVRNENELNTIREYILSNPARWEKDIFFQESH